MPWGKGGGRGGGVKGRASRCFSLPHYRVRRRPLHPFPWQQSFTEAMVSVTTSQPITILFSAHPQATGVSQAFQSTRSTGPEGTPGSTENSFSHRRILCIGFADSSDWDGQNHSDLRLGWLSHPHMRLPSKPTEAPEGRAGHTNSVPTSGSEPYFSAWHFWPRTAVLASVPGQTP